jgi:hypothetical protein
MLYIEFDRNRFVGLAAVVKNTHGERTDGRTDARTHARTDKTKIIVPRFRSGTKSTPALTPTPPFSLRRKFFIVHVLSWPSESRLTLMFICILTEALEC